MKWFRVAIAAALALVLLIFLGAHTNYLVDKVKARIEADTGYHLRIGGEASVGYWPTPVVSLRDVTLAAGGETDAAQRLTAERVRVVLSLRDFLFGQTRIAELSLSRPTLHLPLPRERIMAAPGAASAAVGRALPTIDRIAIEDGTLAFYGQSGRDEAALDRINFEVTHAAGARELSATGSLYFGSQVVDLDLQSLTLPEYFEELAIPIQVSVRAPGLLQNPLSVKAELRSRNGAIAVNTLSGKIGDSIFNGWANVDFAAGKPEITADLDFNTLQLPVPAPERGGAQQDSALSEPWSDTQYDFDPLNYFDARMRISAADMSVGSVHTTLVALETKLSKGVLQAKLVNAALYGGTVEGTLTLDASGVLPAHAVDMHLAGVNALPLLSAAANFDSLDGVVQADIDVLATGASANAVIYSLGGAADVRLYSGALRGIDVAKITRNLTKTTLNGWQWNVNDRTPLNALTAHFDLANGVAHTNNLTLSGPVAQMSGAGNIDISTETLQLRVNPRIVEEQQNIASARDLPGPGQAAGAGLPVLIEGRWSAPRMSSDSR